MMQKIKDYQVVHGDSESGDKVDEKVCEALAQGWVPQGGIFILKLNQGILMAQAMIKYEDSEL